MHKALDVRDDVKVVCVKKAGRWIVSFEDSINALIQWLEDYMGRRRRRLMIDSKNKTGDMKINRTE